ncbi:hypothetical protein [Streptomyces tubercidicus]|uniref:hypothetical protein n=1 Tax=Streptomyces tubercidicus TaxID=47759 RepID=UPI0036C9B996
MLLLRGALGAAPVGEHGVVLVRDVVPVHRERLGVALNAGAHGVLDAHSER